MLHCVCGVPLVMCSVVFNAKHTFYYYDQKSSTLVSSENNTFSHMLLGDL